MEDFYYPISNEAAEGKECAGFLAPCPNTPEFRLDDPGGKGKPVYICTECKEACESMFSKAEKEGKLEKLGEAIDTAHAMNEVQNQKRN